MGEGAASITLDERARLIWVIAQYSSVIEGLYRRHLRGFLSQNSWFAYERTMSDLFKRPLVAAFIKSSTGVFFTDFRDLCMQLIESRRGDDWQYVELESFSIPASAA